jgi:RHS repeat-associated protein
MTVIKNTQSIATLLLLIFSLVGNADVRLPEGEYYQDIDDLTTQVLGGEITIRRTWYKGRWYKNRAWEPLELKDSVFTDELQENANQRYVEEIVRNEDKFQIHHLQLFGLHYNAANCVICGNIGCEQDAVQACTERVYSPLVSAGTVYKLNGTQNVPRHVDKITRTETGFQWTNKEGDWINYDSQGKIQSYGAKRGTIASFSYNASGQRASVLDRLGNTIYTYEYDDLGKLRFVRATGNRQVEYRYTGDLLTEVVDARGQTWQYTYHPQSDQESEIKLATIRDPKGRLTELTYSSTNKLETESLSDSQGNRRQNSYLYDYDRSRKEYYVQVRGPRGGVKELIYDADSILIRKIVNGNEVYTLTRLSNGTTTTHQVQRQRRLRTTKVFDNWHNLIKTTYPDGAETTASYEPDSTQLNERIDELGRITQYEYYENGLLQRRTEAVGTAQERIIEYQYNQYNQLSIERQLGDSDTQEAVTSYTYNTRGLLETITDPEGGVIQYGYNPRGDITSRTDANNHTWTYGYDAAGNLESITDPLNHITRYTYDDVGNRQTATTPRQHTTVYTYNMLDKQISVTDPLSHQSGLSYDIGGNLKTIQDPLGNTHRLDYDLENRLISYQDVAGNLTRLGYGEQAGQGGGLSGGLAYPGLLNRVEFPTYLQTYDYDQRNRRTRVIDHLDNGQAVQTTDYDDVGNAIETTDAEGRITQYRYDALDRLIEVIDPLQQSTRFGYDNRDNLIRVTDPNNHTTRYTYDRADRKRSEIRPGGQVISYDYDSAGNLRTVTDPDGRRTVYSYDSADRLITQAHYASGATVAERTYTYGYDDNDNLASWNDGSISAILTHDENDRKTDETVNYGAFSLTHRYTYDAAGNKRTYTAPDNTTITYHRVNDRLSRIELPNEGSIVYNSYKWSVPERITYPGGSTQQAAYDNLLRPTQILTQDQGQNPLMDYQYNYDTTGNILSKVTQNKRFDYDYDLLQRLTEAAATFQDAEGVTQTEIEGWNYDPNGNRILDNLNPGSWVYDNNDRLQSSPVATYGYDLAGNTISKTVAGVTTSYRYNAEGRLARIEDADQALIAEYQYDPEGRRIRKVTQAETIYFHYTDEGLAGEFDQAGNPIRLYGFAPDATWTTDPIYQKSSAGYAYYQNDHLGMPQQLIRKSGEKVWEGEFRAFGELVAEEGSWGNLLRFPGQYYDEETNNYYNYFRDYDPATGRYLQSDPIGLVGGLNTYAYVYGNPIYYVDSNGLLGGTLNDIGGAFGDAGYDGYGHGVQARQDANSAAAKVNRGAMTEGQSQYRGPADAMRHCVLACSLTHRLGRGVATSMLDRHEAFGDDPDPMDDMNNQMGCFLGENDSDKSCEQKCFDNFDSLMTGRSPDGSHLSTPLPIGEAYR